MWVSTLYRYLASFGLILRYLAFNMRRAFESVIQALGLKTGNITGLGFEFTDCKTSEGEE